MIKVWQFVKTYWYILPIIIITVLCLLFFRKSDILERLLVVVRGSYERQLSETQRLNEEEKKKKEELQMKYDETIKILEEKHNQDGLILEENKKKRVKELVETKTNEELTEMLKKEFDL